MSEKKESIVFAIFIGTIVSLFRIIYSINKYPDTTLVMAVVNVIAAFFVVFIILQDSKKLAIQKVDNSGLGTEDKNTAKDKIKKRKKIVTSITLIISLVVSGIYIRYWRSDVINDVISIWALAISVVSSGIVLTIGDRWYNKID